MTLEQIISSIQSWLVIDQEDDAERLPDSICTLIINLVIRDYCKRRESRFSEYSDTFPTVANQRDYALPTNWSKPRKVWYASPTDSSLVLVEQLNKDIFDSRYPDSTDTDSPVAYTIWAGNIQLGPTPDAIITVNRDYYRILPDLAAGSPNNENRFTQEAYDYILWASLVKATEFGIEDDRVPLWQSEAARAEMALDLEEARAGTTGRTSQSSEPG